MSKPKIDLRPLLRSIANTVQDENVARLVVGEGVRGEPIAPRVTSPSATRSRKRVRVLGERVSLKAIASTPGIRTGDMLKDLGRRSNVKIGRTSFKIVPSSDVIIRTRVFTSGDARQVPRPFSGISREVLADSSQKVAEAIRDQLVSHMQGRPQ